LPAKNRQTKGRPEFNLIIGGRRELEMPVRKGEGPENQTKGAQLEEILGKPKFKYPS